MDASKSKRPAILMAILLVLVLGYLYKVDLQQRFYSVPRVKPLPGKNIVTALEVDSETYEVPVAEFDYFYTGEPMGAYFTFEFARGSTPNSAVTSSGENFYPNSLQPGQHHVSVPLVHPRRSGPTTAVTVNLEAQGQTITSQRVEHAIDWPEWQIWNRNRQFAAKSNDEILQFAMALIDSSRDLELNEAKILLEKSLNRDKRFAPAYVELARVAMKTNWGPEGLHHAENLLNSALQIDAQNVNAKVLLGYVYANQKHFSKAEALFKEAAATDTKNLWLWANWGQLLSMQGDFKGAEEKYREVINRPIGHDTYDRARRDAFSELLILVARTKDLDAIEALYKQRAEEFSSCGCYTEYAKFLIEQRGNTSAAISLTQKAIASGNDAAEARQILGLAYYLNWSSSTGDEKTAALNQARVYLPEGPTALYLLATNDRTVVAAKQLIRNGENIEQLDNEKMTALALALEHKDAAAARRLLQLGAHPEAPIGVDGMPASLIPVMSKDLPSIKILQQFGVDYSKVIYRGMTAFDYAKQISDEQLLKALKRAAMIT